MIRSLKIGILRETKDPPDRRVALTPPQIIELQDLYPQVRFFVQPSDFRCYSNDEYEYLEIPLKEDLSDCDILIGVKEVNKQTIIYGKTYMFFSHVIKKQPQNREMLHEMSKKENTLIDFELLTTEEGRRVVAFGRYAGIVGAYNGLRARGIRTNRFRLKPAYQCRDLEEMWAGLKLIQLKNTLKIAITGGGRVAKGAVETLNACGVTQVSPREYLEQDFNVPVFCIVRPENYVRHKGNLPFDFNHFTQYPGEYESTFVPYAKKTNILITGHFWDPRSPRFFTKEEMKDCEFRISVIADISCDINGGIPSTIRTTTIDDPFFAYNRFAETEDNDFLNPSNIVVMSIDNLPGELPRDASYDFGKQLVSNVMHNLFKNIDSPMIRRATILDSGNLTPRFNFLDAYLKGEIPIFVK